MKTATAAPRVSRRHFTALVHTASAVVQGDRPRLADSLASVAPDALFATAVRHRCAGFLLRGMDVLGVRDPSGGRLTAQLRAVCRAGAFQAVIVRSQLESLVATLSAAQLPFVLLKGAARLYEGDPDAHWNGMFDLDILVRDDTADAVANALIESGYRYGCDEALVSKYRWGHHHFAPLEPARPGVPVELHRELAPPDSLSKTFDWETLAPYFRTISGAAGDALGMDALGSALHLAIHGLHVRRLYDVVLLARSVHADPTIAVDLSRIFRDERRCAVALSGVVALAAAIAGLECGSTKETRRYLNWILRREDLPTYLRARTQMADEWYSNGRRVGSLSTRRNSSTSAISDTMPGGVLRKSASTIGRYIVGACASLYAGVLLKSDSFPKQDLYRTTD